MSSHSRTVPLAAVLALILLALTGCSTDGIHHFTRDNPAPLSDYLPNHKLLKRLPDTFPFQYAWASDTIPENYYRHVYIAPVDTRHLRADGNWEKFDKTLNGRLGNDIDTLAAFFRKAYELEFVRVRNKSQLDVVSDRKLPRTIVIEPAIITVTPTKAELNAVGFVGSFWIPGLGLAAGLVSSGALVVECIVRDGETGRIIAMYADTESDPVALINISSFTWTTSAQINMKNIARYTAELFVAEDSMSVRRTFPLHLISLASDGDL